MKKVGELDQLGLSVPVDLEHGPHGIESGNRLHRFLKRLERACGLVLKDQYRDGNGDDDDQ